jgi:hypothetical protein
MPDIDRGIANTYTVDVQHDHPAIHDDDLARLAFAMDACRRPQRAPVGKRRDSLAPGVHLLCQRRRDVIEIERRRTKQSGAKVATARVDRGPDASPNRIADKTTQRFRGQ